MKKVLVCRCSLLPYSETFIREQVLSYSRWQPTLAGLRRVPGLPLDEMQTRVLLEASPNAPKRAYYAALQLLNRAPRIVVERLRAEAPSLVHVHFGVDAVTLWPALKQLEVPVVVTLHGYDINRSRESWERRWWVPNEHYYPQRLIRMARHPNVHFVAVSEVIKRRAIDYGIPAEKLSVQYIGIDTQRFNVGAVPVNRRPPRILFVGRLVEKKGGEYLLEAFARVRKDVPDAELVMIGDGPKRAELGALAARLNVPVTFAGSLSSDEVKRHIDAARVFCAPSVTAQDGDAEGLPIVLLEAQACGVPAVTSAGAGGSEALVHGATGFAFRERDVDTLHQQLTRILHDDALALAMSAAAPQLVVERFELRHCTQKLEALYDSLVRTA